MARRRVEPEPESILTAEDHDRLRTIRARVADGGFDGPDRLAAAAFAWDLSLRPERASPESAACVLAHYGLKLGPMGDAMALTQLDQLIGGTEE